MAARAKWNYYDLKNALLQHPHKSQKREYFVPNVNYPHFHIGDDFIVLSTNHHFHNPLINPQGNRTR